MAKKDENIRTPKPEAAQAADLALAAAEVQGAQAAGNKAGAEAQEVMSIEEAAGRLRLASWQSAALNRLMGWASGKQVTEKEYRDALARLNNRRIGG